MAATDKASSSSSASTHGSSTYDVFLSFRGADTRHSFTGFLHKALKDRGIKVFFDSEALWTGDAIGPLLLRAIEGSKMSIPIFSERYAESHWCLRELAKIVECHTSNNQLVMPIFFLVDPSHVCNQTGTFQEAFCKHKKRFEPYVLKNWRDALEVVGSMEGEVLDKTGDRAKLVESVVQKVLYKFISSTHLAESKYLIGIDSRVKDMESLLNIGSSDVQFVGICGSGGIGKTTIAKAVYNRNLLIFNKHSFLSNVREQAMEHMGLVSLQKRLLKDICKRDIDIADYHIGKTLIEQRLSKEKVLIVVDDVDNQEQVDALAGEVKWFGSGSRVIITTRDEDILTMANYVYKPQLLDHEQALQLFSWHAFQKDQIPEDYMQLSHDVAHYSGGLPFTLEELGSSLAKISSKKMWESKIQELREIAPEKVQRRLKESYDSLENDYQKSIFLDAACFFIGWEKETVMSIWEACGYHPTSAIDKLIKRSLLKFGDEYEGHSYLQMHDHIRDMGREIVLQDSPMKLGERTRLWTYDEIEEVLEGNKGTGKIKGLSLPYASSLIDLPIESLKRMVNLKFLEISSADFEGDFSHLPSALRCFKWNGCHWTIVPTDFYHKRLIYLNISDSNIEQAWNVKPQDKSELFQKLKVLDLNRCKYLSKSPNFSWFPHLERLDLRLCKSLDKLDKSIKQLSQLKNLILRGCDSLKELPKSIGNLKSLVELDLSDCYELKELPDGVGLLEKLEILNAENCCKLMKLPRSMQRMSCLHSIKLRRTRISDIPEDFSLLSDLVVLDVSCVLKCFPLDLSHLKKLKQLTLYKCKKLVHLPELPSSLIELRCEECNSLVRLSDLSRLKILRKICLRGCTRLEEIAGLEGAESLAEFDVQGCFKLTYTPRQTHGWGTLSDESSLEYSYSLAVTDGIYNNKGLVLCLVFHVLSSSEFSCESIDFHISASIRQKDQTIWCLHTLRIEEVNFDRGPHQDIIYIHHFKGFDWFGIPMEGKDDIVIHDIYKTRNQTYELKFWKLLFENREPEHLFHNQHSSAMMMMIASPLDNTGGNDQEHDDTDEEEEEEELEILSPPRPRGILYESLPLLESKSKEGENPLMKKAMLKDEVLLMDIRGLILDDEDEVISLSPLSTVEEELLRATATTLGDEDEDDDDEAASPSPIDNADEALLRAIGRILLENDEVYEVSKAMERFQL